MPYTVTKVQIGWKALETLINAMIGAINGNMPVAGEGILISDLGEQGTMISLSPDGNDGGAGKKQAATDPHVLLQNLVWAGVKWQTVTVVDPATCVQSTLTVLTPGSATDYVTIPLGPYNIWASQVSST